MIKVILELHHHGDWTEITANNDVKFLSINHLIDPINRYNIEAVLAYGNEINDLINKLKKHRNIYKVTKIDKVRKNLYVISFIGGFENSVRKILWENKIVAQSLLVEDGIEKFMVFLDDYKIMEKIKEDLERNPQISIDRMKIRNINFSDFIRILTPLESEIILTAYKKGFFENPRRISLTELSSEFYMSKAALNYHIRNAIKKIITFYQIITFYPNYNDL